MMNLPTLTNRQFGVEIEFIGASPEKVAEAINDSGIEAYFEGYHHSTRPYWKIVTDGSLSQHYTSAGEIVSPILRGKEGAIALQNVLAALENIEGIRVDRSCGVHVHLDVNDLSVKQVQATYSRYADFESQIDMVMPLSRRGDRNEWCRSTKNRKSQVNHTGINTKQRLENAVSGQCNGKYHKVNINKLTTYGTMEFRQHSGTHDFKKVINWISFLMAFVETSAMLTESMTINFKPKKSRAYHTLRTLLENNGFDLAYKSGSKMWIITGSYTQSDGGVVSYSRHFYGMELEDLYATTKETSLMRDEAALFLQNHLFNINDTELMANPYFDYTLWDYIKPADIDSAPSIQEEGWLTGVDSNVQRYFAERELELN